VRDRPGADGPSEAAPARRAVDGLAPIFVEKIFEIVRTINAQGTPVLLVEQNALMALDTAHRGYVMETGQDHARRGRRGPQVQRGRRKAYLGLE
jgi:branched-chain amino acid transport system ATP-binding protein